MISQDTLYPLSTDRKTGARPQAPESDMCTVVILRRPGHPWPIVFAANRDEMLDRPWQAPGRHWPDRPEVVAGLDRARAAPGSA